MPDRRRIGIDLGGTKIHAVLLDGAGQVLSERRRATPRGDYDATVEALLNIARELDHEGALTVGIGTPGSLIPGARVMRNCNSTWLNGRPLLDDLTAVLGERVRIANDADCFALSEAHGGAADGAPSVFGVILGTGVGGGIVVNGELLAGPNGLAGEWGHAALPRLQPAAESSLEARLGSRQCYCGRLNCVETFLAGPALARTHLELWDEQLTAAEIYARAGLDRQPLSAAGDPELPAAATTDAQGRARLTLTLWCRQLARSLAQVVNIVDPAVIVLGGGLSNMRELYEPVRAVLGSAVFGGSGATPIVAPKFGAASGVRGAAWLFGGPSSERSAAPSRSTRAVQR